MLVMGWHGQSTHALFSIGSTVDPIIEQTPCDVIILKDCGGNRIFRNALVPLAGGPNGALALETASILCGKRQKAPDITVLNIDTGRHVDIRAFVAEQTARRGLDSSRFEIKTITARDPIEAILKEASAYDLVVLGAAQKSVLMQFATRSIPEEVARQCDRPTVLVKANVGVRSWIKRWI
jgi:nucleotide-binding universal stress UspA family protein